jgi:hypothetical protein
MNYHNDVHKARHLTNNAEHKAVDLDTYAGRPVLLCTKGHVNVFDMNVLIHAVDITGDMKYVLMNPSWR